MRPWAGGLSSPSAPSSLQPRTHTLTLLENFGSDKFGSSFEAVKILCQRGWSYFNPSDQKSAQTLSPSQISYLQGVPTRILQCPISSTPVSHGMNWPGGKSDRPLMFPPLRSQFNALPSHIIRPDVSRHSWVSNIKGQKCESQLNSPQLARLGALLQHICKVGACSQNLA